MDDKTIGSNHSGGNDQKIPAMVERSFRSHINYTGGGLIIYLVLFLGIQIAAEIIGAVILVLKDPGLANWDRFDEYYNSIIDLSMNGWVYIGSLIIGLLVLFIYFRKKLPAKDIFRSPNRMTMKSFLPIFFIFFAGQLVGSVINIVLELILNIFGLSNDATAELMNEIFNHPSMIIYAAIGAPIAEEIVFRGFLMRRFQAWGKVFAIVMSSLLFGLFHMNFVQLPYAFIVGLVLAYAAMEYGIKWSILLHFLNNGVLACGLGLLSKRIGETKAACIEYVILGVFFAAGLYFFIAKRRTIADYIRRNRTEKSRYFWTFTTATILILIAITLGVAVLTLLSADMTEDLTSIIEK